MKIRIKNTVLVSMLLLVCCLAGFSATASEGYYKWHDERGNPQHSDRPPPPGVEYDFISTDTGLRRTVKAAPAEKPGSSRAAVMPPAAAEPTAALEEQVKIKKNPAYCDQARANLDTLNSSARVRIRNKEGEISYLSDEEKDIQRRKANDMISVHCN